MALEIDIDAPGFTLQDTEGEEQSLSDYQNRHVVLLFFPLAFSGVCTKELCRVRDNMKMYDSLGAAVLAISVDSFFALRAFKKAENLNCTLLSDFNRTVSKKYDTLYEDYFGMKGVAKRSAYIVDKNGKIRYAEVLEDSEELPDFDRIRKTLKAL